jgi:hypothetical protein
MPAVTPRGSDMFSRRLMGSKEDVLEYEACLDLWGDD